MLCRVYREIRLSLVHAGARPVLKWPTSFRHGCAQVKYLEVQQSPQQRLVPAQRAIATSPQAPDTDGCGDRVMQSSHDSPTLISNFKVHGVRYHRHRAVQLTGSVQPRESKRRMKMAESARVKLLVNQTLKDKGESSKNLCLPIQLLLRHHRPQPGQLRMAPNKRVQPRIPAVGEVDSLQVASIRRVQAKTPAEEEVDSLQLASIRRVQAKIPAEEEVDSLQLASIRRVQPKILAEEEVDSARNISEPSIHSEQNIIEYVNELVRSQTFYRKLYSSDRPVDSRYENLKTVVAALDRVFNRTSFKGAIPVEAYNIALRFYYGNDLLSKARDIFIQIEESYTHIPTETFNIMLQGSASSNDLHNFTFLLDKFLSLCFKPDAETWHNLFRTTTNNNQKKYIIQKMREKGIWDPSFPTESIAKVVIKSAIPMHVEACAKGDTILDCLDDHYGKAWLTTTNGNVLLSEYSKRWQVSEALELLSDMRIRGFVPNEVSLSTLLHQCSMFKQHKSAIRTVEVFQRDFGYKVTRDGHEVLFLLAWKSHLLNFSRVIWRSACVHELTTARMRSLVMRSITSLARDESLEHSNASGTNTPISSKAEKFGRIAGRFVMGVREFPSDGHLSSAARDRLMEDMRVDYNARKDDLSNMLTKALRIDMVWAAQKFWMGSEWQKIVRRGLRTKFKRFRIRKYTIGHPRICMPSVMRKHKSGLARAIQTRPALDQVLEVAFGSAYPAPTSTLEAE